MRRLLESAPSVTPSRRALGAGRFRPSGAPPGRSETGRRRGIPPGRLPQYREVSRRRRRWYWVCLYPGMVDTVIRLTVLLMLALGALNALHAGAVVVRLLHRLARRRGGLALLLPTFTSTADIRDWLEDWRVFLNSGDPALIALRHDARVVIGRHIHLTIVSNTWALAVMAIAP